jgi:hypothetical protein
MSTSAVQRDRSGWERLSASVRPEGRALIAGRPVAARDGGVFDDVSPIDGKVVWPRPSAASSSPAPGATARPMDTSDVMPQTEQRAIGQATRGIRVFGDFR